jgi:hypothetical protein
MTAHRKPQTSRLYPERIFSFMQKNKNKNKTAWILSNGNCNGDNLTILSINNIINRKLLTAQQSYSHANLEEALKSSPLVTLKDVCRRQIERSEIYRVSVLRKVATFG